MKIAIGKGKRDLTANEIARACDAELVCLPEYIDCKIRFVCTDSREARADTLFVAIKGEHTDGHNFILSTVSHGCRCFLCENIPQNIPALTKDTLVFIKVNNVTEALGRIAGYYVKKCCRDVKCIGITGSVGKTTAKEMISAVLSVDRNVHKTQGNYNSDIGLPLVLLETPDMSDVNVIEMGMGQRGDISYLSRISEPDVAVITAIGSSHIESLGSRENIALEKLDITAGMKADSMLIINGDEPLLSSYSNKDINIISVSLNNSQHPIYATNIRYGLFSIVFDLVDNIKSETLYNVLINLPGEHNIYAALFAYTIASCVYKMDPHRIKSGIASFRSVGMRQNIKPLGKGMLLVEDCYNASPESMIASLKAATEMKRLKESRLIAVLGDMLELGDMSRELHEKVGKNVAQLEVDLLITFGTQARYIAEAAKNSGLPEERIITFDDVSDSVADICAYEVVSRVCADDVILVKASRGIKAERISSYIENRFKIFGVDKL